MLPATSIKTCTELLRANSVVSLWRFFIIPRPFGNPVDWARLTLRSRCTPGIPPVAVRKETLLPLRFSYVFKGPNGYAEEHFSATASGANTVLSFTSSGRFSVLFLDDISVEPAGVGVPDSGTTVSLLGCALLGLAGLRRRLGC